MMWRLYLRRIRGSSDAAKRRWIAVVGGAAAVLIVALWLMNISRALPKLTASDEATTTGEPAGDALTGGIRSIRDGFSEQWRAASENMSEAWQSLGTPAGGEPSATGTESPTEPQPTGGAEPINQTP